MALVTTDYEVNPFPLGEPEKELPPPPDVAITPCGDLWPRPYFLENGLRRVAPYHYTYNTFCKQRWRGRGILDIFAAEFRDRSEEYYRAAIEEGRIVLNGKPCTDTNTKVQNGDVISHTLHRHEPPVTAQPIRAIHEDDDMIVIDKPAGVPVHPAGRYKFNSVVEIMRAERDHSFNPLPCNRLDRLTSGVMFIGKTPKKAEAISQKLRERTVRKEYVARVKGRFPDGEDWNGDPMRGGVVKCEEPILQISPILGLNRARASGKSAKTLFRRIAYYPSKEAPAQSNNTIPRAVDLVTGQAAALPAVAIPGAESEGYSIVHCLPLTGRTHQLRVHLQFLGHPISNDPIYSNRKVFGPDLGRNDATGENDAEIMARLSNMGKTEIADAYSYDQDEKEKLKIKKKSHPPPKQDIELDVSNLVDQTQQITLSDLKAATSQSESSSQQNHYKPLPQSLHAGSLDSSSDPNQDQSSDPLYSQYVAAHDEAVADYNRRKGEKLTGEHCSICDTPLYSDPGPQELGIYLHALAYGDLGGEWRYTSFMPEWAKPPTGKEGPIEVGEWVYEGVGKEGLEIDEEAYGKERNDVGMRRNRELATDGTSG